MHGVGNQVAVIYGMKPFAPAWTRLVMAVLVPAWLLAVPATGLGAQARGRSHTPSGGGGHAAGGGSGQRGGGTAVPRGDRGGSSGTRGGDKGATGNGAGSPSGPADRGPTRAVPSSGRSRDERTPAGRAVPRSSAPATSRSGIFVPGYYRGYYPWGFGGLGFGGYYGGYYDPFGGYYDPYGGYQGYPRSSDTFGYEGKLHLKVTPRDASVWVDGYYVGIVDDFDGVFQRLHIEAGPHRIDISAPGYEPVAFDVRIEWDRTLTYRGELRKIP